MSLKKFSNLVALPHSVFALPFALASFHLAAQLNIQAGVPSQSSMQKLAQLIFVVLAVVAARTSAMAFNRLVDAHIDAKNPRTKNRELPAGALTAKSVKLLIVLSTALFLACAAALGIHCLMLAPFVLLILFAYSYSKRYTNFSHLLLGLSLAAAPGGAWWVLRPEVETTPLMLMFAVLFWVAGFDILYSCQDFEFDKNNNLHSVPARFGIERALLIAKFFHFVSLGFFIAVGISANLETAYFWGLGVIGALMLGQHFLISANNLNRINHAFFTANGCISILYFLLVLNQ